MSVGNRNHYNKIKILRKSLLATLHWFEVASLAFHLTCKKTVCLSNNCNGLVPVLLTMKCIVQNMSLDNLNRLSSYSWLWKFAVQTFLYDLADAGCLFKIHVCVRLHCVMICWSVCFWSIFTSILNWGPPPENGPTQYQAQVTI